MNKKKASLSILCASLLISNINAKELKEHTLDDIIVTAQKTEENIKDVPISISVLDEFFLQDTNIASTNDIDFYVPNFKSFDIGDSSRYTPVLRGLSAESRTFFTNVATYVDGVPYLDSMGNNILFDDIERIEVLKGPQGTLYGKNTYAGVINVITKKPDNEARKKVGIKLAEDKKRELSLNISTPIIDDKLYTSFLTKYHKKDGYIKNTYLNRFDNSQEDKYAKLYLRYTPTDSLEFSLISSYLKKNDGANSVVGRNLNNYRQTQSDQIGFNRPNVKSLALKAEYTNKNFKFTSTSSYKKQNEDMYVDYDWSDLNMLNYKVEYPFENFNQEFRLDTSFGNFDYLIGVNLYKDDKSPNFKFNGFDIQDNNIKSQSFGIFNHLKYKVNDKLDLIAGLRYDKDKVKLDDRLANDKQEKTYEEVSPKIALNYRFNENTSTYFNISKGYKSGGYFMFAPSSKKAYGKESLYNYELGLKSKLLDDKLSINSSFFYMDVKDMQVMVNTDPMNGYIANAAEVTSKGFELEANYLINENLSSILALGYNDTRFDNFKDSLGDYSNKYNPLASKYNYSLALQYRADNNIFARFEVQGQSSFYTDKANTNKVDGYTLFNSKIGYETENFEVYLYGKNLANKKYDTVGYIDNFVIVSPPREIGFELNYRF